MNGFNLGADFTLVKTVTAVTLPCMTGGSDTCRAQSSTKFLLLLVYARGLCCEIGVCTDSLMLYC
ncbi:MAG: hypothetical protein QGI20_13350, partial [Verrucomicrobiota bacterium]|nr:hypothetical protein [Verrucomicrobiota bacterium]